MTTSHFFLCVLHEHCSTKGFTSMKAEHFLHSSTRNSGHGRKQRVQTSALLIFIGSNYSKSLFSLSWSEMSGPCEAMLIFVRAALRTALKSLD